MSCDKHKWHSRIHRYIRVCHVNSFVIYYAIRTISNNDTGKTNKRTSHSYVDTKAVFFPTRRAGSCDEYR